MPSAIFIYNRTDCVITYVIFPPMAMRSFACRSPFILASDSSCAAGTRQPLNSALKINTVPNAESRAFVNI